MPGAFKVVRDSAVNFPRPGGGVTWDVDVFEENTGVIGLTSGNGVAGFVVGKTGTYAISLGRYETIGSLGGDIWDQLAGNTDTSITLTANTQYYLQGPIGVSRQAVIALGYNLSVSSSSSADTGSVNIRGLDVAGVEVRETLILSGTSVVSSSYVYAEVTTITKDETTGSVKVADAQGHYFKLSPKQTQSRFTRIEFDVAPTDVKTMTVVFKKRVRDLVSDGDAPQVNSVDHALMTFALGDLYTKQRQLSKAAVKYEEGVALLNVLRDRESVQQANQIVVVPEDLGGWQARDFGWL